MRHRRKRGEIERVVSFNRESQARYKIYTQSHNHSHSHIDTALDSGQKKMRSGICPQISVSGSGCKTSTETTDICEQVVAVKNCEVSLPLESLGATDTDQEKS